MKKAIFKFLLLDWNKLVMEAHAVEYHSKKQVSRLSRFWPETSLELRLMRDTLCFSLERKIDQREICI